MRLLRLSLAFVFFCFCLPVARAQPADAAPKTIVLIAGTKSHGPGHHEYEKGARLLAACLEAAPNLPEIRTEVYLDGWPDDEAVLERADTIFLFSDGSDRDGQAHPLLRGERLKTMEKLMARGVGLVAIHYTVFVPSRRGGPEFLEWIGGYFDYENGSAPNKWFSRIGVHRTQAQANTSHPIARGLGKFELEEEYYYNIRFRKDDERLTPILTTPIPGEEHPQVVAWAVERAGGGRGFGFTGGHFHSNWGVDEFRKLVLNALVWTAKIEVPPGGVESRVSKVDLTVQPPDAPAGDATAPIKTLILPQLEDSTYQAADPELKVVLLDRSARESFLSVRVDGEGRLFAGGREALFVYEPDPAGGYLPRRELYRFPPHSWITDIEIRGNDLYVMTASAIYLFAEARTAEAPVEPKRLIWGLPLDLHVTMHGLAWGPEGDLYFAAGDPLLNYGDFERADHWGHWTIYSQPEGTETPYTGAGGVFRCRPDGSGLEVLARGTRGSDGLAFDRYWNLFTNDNDHESLAHRYSPARLLHVTPHTDFHWPRGWMPSITPERAELLEPVYDGMVRGVPVGQAYYDDPFFPAEYRNNLLVARWDLRSVTRYPLVPRGASLSAGEHQLLSGQGNARPVGVAVGRGGRVFAAISSMAQNEGSPTYPSDLVMITTAADPPSSPFEACDPTRADEALLWRELSHDAWSRRLAAHQEILRRGGGLLAGGSARIKNLAPDDPAWLHLPWLSAASGTREAAGLLAGLAEDPRPQIRLQAVRALTEMWQRADRAGDKAGASADDQNARRKIVVRALSDPSPPVQLAALAACFSLEGPLPDEVDSAAARSSDSYLRQTATTLLAERAGIERLAELCHAPDASGRLAGVLAAGCRLTVPPATGPVPAGLELKYFSPNALFVIDYADARIDLRDGRRVGSFTIAEQWKTIPRTAEQERLFELLLAMLDDPAEAVRLQAAHFLYLLDDPRSEPLIPRARSRGTLERLATAPYQAIDAAWLIGPFDAAPPGKPSSGPDRLGPVEEGPVDLSAGSEVGGRTLEWRKAASAEGRYDLAALLEAGNGSPRGEVSYLYCRLESARPEPCMLIAESAGGVLAWHNGRPVQGEAALLLKLEPGSNDLVVRVNGAVGGMRELSLGFRADGDVRVALPEKLGSETLAERLKSATGDASQTIPEEFFQVDWSNAAKTGDAGRGRRLFGADALGCVKCHAVTPQQSGAGAPSLADAARRFTVPHLVESILLPSKEVAPLFRATSIETDEGLPLTGLVVRETDDELELLLPDATRKILDKRRIEARELQEISPMPGGVVKTPQELADLLAYLLSDNPVPP